MRPKERRDSGQKDLFRARLDQIVDMTHPLARLAARIDWGFLEQKFGAVYSEAAGHPPLPTRLMAGLAILKHMHDLSDEALCARWLENPYFQLFCGEEFFQHKLVFDRSSMTRWRQRMGEEKLVALIQESLSVATKTGAAKPADFSKVIVDTTVQPKAVAHPTDAKLMHRAREKSWRRLSEQFPAKDKCRSAGFGLQRVAGRLSRCRAGVAQPELRQTPGGEKFMRPSRWLDG
jgi:IS5 family transposase